MELRSFYFHHPQMFVVPVEHLRPEGLTREFRDALLAEREVEPDWIECFERALADYFERVQVLFARARRTWFPPRLQNVCVVTDPESTRPYYQPFDKASWLLYADDFDPASTSREFAVYQLVHAERMGIARTVQSTVLQNLSWFTLRSEGELQDFVQGVARSTRPDVAGFAALGKALPWVSKLHHASLAPPAPSQADNFAPLPETETLVDTTQAVAVRGLVDAFEAAVRRVVQGYFEAVGRPVADTAAPQLVREWLMKRRPRLLLGDRSGSIVWDCDDPTAVEQAADAVADMTEPAARSLCEDLAVVDERTATFLTAVDGPERLPRHGEQVEQENGIYLHEDRRLIVYCLEQPGLDTRREPSPPYHRLLVGARTMHEWGHLACDAAMAGLDPQLASRHADALGQLAALFDEVVAAAPKRERVLLCQELGLPLHSDRLGRSLAERPLQRIQDYLANLIARELLPVEEMEAYVRANVKTLVREGQALLSRLPRYAYEYQYLRLSRMADPRHYFLASTWFHEQYFDNELLTTAQADRMLDLMGRICDCYQVRPGALR